MAPSADPIVFSIDPTFDWTATTSKHTQKKQNIQSKKQIQQKAFVFVLLCIIFLYFSKKKNGTFTDSPTLKPIMQLGQETTKNQDKDSFPHESIRSPHFTTPFELALLFWLGAHNRDPICNTFRATYTNLLRAHNMGPMGILEAHSATLFGRETRI